MSRLASHYACHGCDTVLAADEPAPYRCPRADGEDGADHVLERVLELEGTRFPFEGDTHPFIRFRELLHSWRFARRAGLGDQEWCERVRGLDTAIAELWGHGFEFTPWSNCAELARELGVASLWIKDETRGVGGSHKARHLFDVALHRLTTEADSAAPLAIASCGNAALAAAIVARAAGWPLSAFVPQDAKGPLIVRLTDLGATLVPCAREAGDAPGDPCVARLRAALEDGARPFTVQGPECALALEGGRTLAYELALQHAGQPPLDALFVQVGGGALASSTFAGLQDAKALGALVRLPAVFTVQPAGGHPLERAWRAFTARYEAELEARGENLHRALHTAARSRADFMWPWEPTPASIAHGILDDETHDWYGALRAMVETGGRPVVVSEGRLTEARERARAATGIRVDATGAAGLAGVMELAEQGALSSSAHVGVLFTGGEL